MSDGHGGGHAEIVIIHRGHGDHDDHHGGAWKIAFADFMTAMMAFFLVMWLVGANDKTRASVARYFNPVKLVDTTTRPRGLSDPRKDDAGSKDDSKIPFTKAVETGKGVPVVETPKGKEKRLDAQLQDNPYVALAEIVGDKGPGEDHVKDAAGKPAIGHSGVAFRDPFAPPPGAPDIDDDTPPDELPGKAVPQPSAPAATQTKADAGTTETNNVKKPQDITKMQGAKTQDAKQDAAGQDVAKMQAATPPNAPTKTQDATKTQETVQKQTADFKSKIMAAMTGLGPESSGPSIDVRKTGEGTLISLTDTANYTMFSNGSAVPDRRVILMMEKIAQAVKDKPGELIIRGFTDNKKFKTGRYDNWHLSLDRAQVAHYMLVRGGLDEARISHVEAYADHDAMPGVDPADPRNRRIELLLKDDPR